MRKTLSLFLLFAGILAGSAWLAADEGQWLPEQLRGLDWANLEARGLELGPDELWDGEKGLLTAAVQINGCSASFVSPDGLILTNHHCGFDAISELSTVETNLLESGFVAGRREDELHAPGYRISFVRGYEDVTEEIHAAAEVAGKDPASRWKAVEARRAELAAEARTDHTDAIVVPYFHGREWRRIHRTVLRDVRLVYAPPRAIGEYGGDVDNWEWPRHTGDFSAFRAYVSPEGLPASFSEDNIPFNPPRHLSVSEEGVEEGDLVMLMGYPGRTTRYLTSVAVAANESWTFPQLLDYYITAIDALDAAVSGIDELELQAAPTLNSLNNVKKRAEGVIWGLARNTVVEDKRDEEVAFQAWVNANPSRIAKWGTVLEEMLELDTEEAGRQERDFALDLLARRSPGLRAAIRMARDPEADVSQYLESALAMADEELFDFVCWRASKLSEGKRIAGFDAWDEESGAEGLAPLLLKELGDLKTYRDRLAGQRLAIGPVWIEAQEAWRGQRFYPDANSTLRVSIATVKGYQPRDGIFHVPRTTVAGMLEKHTGQEPFILPEAFQERLEAAPGDADVPVCFLSDGDTTGGNSGSAMVDGKGRLVGLNFDRVFEAVAGDFRWSPEVSRNISVDIRFVLWTMREVWPAPHLLDEMGVE